MYMRDVHTSTGFSSGCSRCVLQTKDVEVGLGSVWNISIAVPVPKPPLRCWFLSNNKLNHYHPTTRTLPDSIVEQLCEKKTTLNIRDCTHFCLRVDFLASELQSITVRIGFPEYTFYNLVYAIKYSQKIQSQLQILKTQILRKFILKHQSSPWW